MFKKNILIGLFLYIFIVIINFNIQQSNGCYSHHSPFSNIVRAHRLFIRANGQKNFCTRYCKSYDYVCCICRNRIPTQASG
ncbi:unnamed protein product [Gordionus sp. m RMFG-2023]